jgi:hypothetical protein
MQGTATKAGTVSATPIHLPNPQAPGVKEQVGAASGMQEGPKAGTMMNQSVQTPAHHPKNELK